MANDAQTANINEDVQRSSEISIITSSRRVVTLNFDNVSKTLNIRFAGDSKIGSSENVSVNARHVIWTEFDGRQFELSLIHNNAGKGVWSFVQYVGQPEADSINNVERWCSVVMSAAYEGLKTSRKLRVLINPKGGPGKAGSIYLRTVEPILKAARCAYDTTHTTHSKHAQQIAKEMPLDYDAIVILSGDGLTHEVVNGFSEHEDPIKAFSIPIAPVPTGSGNALPVNLMGPKDGFDVVYATLNAIKGVPMRADILSCTKGDKRVYSFLTQAMGLMAELDYETEHLRWMGDTRFVYGFIRGVARRKTCPVKLSIKVVEQDKHAMAKVLRSKKTENTSGSPDPVMPGNPASPDVALDPFRSPSGSDTSRKDDGWITIDEPLIYVYAGKGPYVGRDLMQFPVSEPVDGYIDIAAQPMTSRLELLSCAIGAEKGEQYWKDSLLYYKATAYRVEPVHQSLSASSSSSYGANFSSNAHYVMIDGEHHPLEPFEVEVHRGLGTFLSPTGRYASNFEFGKHKTQKAPQRTVDSKGKGKSRETGRSGWRKFLCCA